MYAIRLMQPRDVPAVRKLHAEQNQRDSTNYPFNAPFDSQGRRNPNVPLAIAITDGDEVRQGAAIERTAELMLFGCDPRATAALHRQIRGVFYLMEKKGYTGVHCFVPKKTSWWRAWLLRIAACGDVARSVGTALGDVGFVRGDARFACFFKELRPE